MNQLNNISKRTRISVQAKQLFTSHTSILILRKMSQSTYSPFPVGQGPFATGCTDFMAGRTTQGVFMRFYYPSSLDNIQNHKEQWTPWYLGCEYIHGLSKFAFPLMPSFFETMFNWSTKAAKFPSVLDAPIAEGKFPVVLFSHGLSGHRGFYTTICNELASYGFFVAALEHRDESACGTFTLNDSGQKEWILYKMLEKKVKEHPLRNKQVKIRTAESIRALDILEMLNDGEVDKNELPSAFDHKSLKNRLDVSQSVMAGHSFGGATTILALSMDERFKMGLLLDPWMFPIKDDVQKLAQSVKQPLLSILTEAFQNTVNFKAYHAFDLPRNTFITIKGSVHQSQSDAPFLANTVGKILGGCWASIDEKLAMSLNNTLLLNFICKNLAMPNIESGIDSNIIQSHLLFGLQLQERSLEEVEQMLSSYQSNNNEVQNNNVGEVTPNISYSKL